MSNQLDGNTAQVSENPSIIASFMLRIDLLLPNLSRNAEIKIFLLSYSQSGEPVAYEVLRCSLYFIIKFYLILFTADSPATNKVIFCWVANYLLINMAKSN